MKLLASSWTLTGAFVVIIVAGACSLAPRARPSLTFVATATPMSVSTAQPTRRAASPTPLLAVRTERPDQGHPPPAGLLGSGGEIVAGYPGSYCFGDTCAEIGGWPSKSELPRLRVTADAMTFSIEGEVAFVTWSAAYQSRANDDASKSLGRGGYPYDPDASASPPPSVIEATIPAPPAGDWVVWIWVDLEHGDLSYAWHVIVD